jgi:hypothetical protein
MEAEWSESKKWSMDVLKSGITFTIAALVSLFLIDHIQEQRIQNKAKADAAYATRLKALAELRLVTVQYDTAADAAFADLFEWSGRQKTSAMVRYEQEIYPQWLSATETASHMFPLQSAEIANLATTALKRHAIYDKLVDERLDSRDASESIDPWPVREDFKSLSAQLVTLRSELIGNLQSAVFLAESQ